MIVGIQCAQIFDTGKSFPPPFVIHVLHCFVIVCTHSFFLFLTNILDSKALITEVSRGGTSVLVLSVFPTLVASQVGWHLFRRMYFTHLLFVFCVCLCAYV